MVPHFLLIVLNSCLRILQLIEFKVLQVSPSRNISAKIFVLLHDMIEHSLFILHKGLFWVWNYLLFVKFLWILPVWFSCFSVIPHLFVIFHHMLCLDFYLVELVKRHWLSFVFFEFFWKSLEFFNFGFSIFVFVFIFRRVKSSFYLFFRVRNILENSLSFIIIILTFNVISFIIFVSCYKFLLLFFNLNFLFLFAFYLFSFCIFSFSFFFCCYCFFFFLFRFFLFFRSHNPIKSINFSLINFRRFQIVIVHFSCSLEHSLESFFAVASIFSMEPLCEVYIICNEKLV